MKDFIIAFHYCVPEVHTTNWERNEFPPRCQSWVTSFVPDKDIPQSLYLSFFFLEVWGGFVTDLLLAGHTMATYVLKFHRLGKEIYLLLPAILEHCALQQLGTIVSPAQTITSHFYLCHTLHAESVTKICWKCVHNSRITLFWQILYISRVYHWQMLRHS